MRAMLAAADFIGKWRAADPVSRRMASAYSTIPNSLNLPNGACPRGYAVRQRSSRVLAGAECQSQHDFALDGSTNRK
jgi:hypothetical protein